MRNNQKKQEKKVKSDNYGQAHCLLNNKKESKRTSFQEIDLIFKRTMKADRKLKGNKAIEVLVMLDIELQTITQRVISYLFIIFGCTQRWAMHLEI